MKNIKDTYASLANYWAMDQVYDNYRSNNITLDKNFQLSHVERQKKEESDESIICNRVESLLTETPSHTTVQAMSHTAVLLLCLPKANERLKSPNLLNHSRFIALCTI